TVVVGRRPQARQVSSLDLPLLVVLDNPYVSGTHLEFHLEADTVLVTDVSSNGTLLTRSGGRPERLRSGQPTPLSDGAVLQLTEGLTATVSIGRGTES